MDRQNRVGGRTGGGGVASASESNVARKERLRQLALETIDITKDPYIMINHVGQYECKLCLTIHRNDGSYLAHTQGKKHQENLARRKLKEAKDQPIVPAPSQQQTEFKQFVKIGRPGYRITKQRTDDSLQDSLFFQIDYPSIADDVKPLYRFMSAYEQKVEAPQREYQYVIVAAEPYETISFKIPSREVDKRPEKTWCLWNADTKQFFVQVHFKVGGRAPVRAHTSGSGSADDPPPPPPPQ